MVPERVDVTAGAYGFAETWKRVLSDPRGFFTEMPEAGGLREPMAFLASCAALNAAGIALVHLGLVTGLLAFVAHVAVAVILAVVLVLVAQHLFEGRAGFEPTLRVVAYAAAPTVFAWVPRLGVIAIVWGWFLMVRGLERVQGYDAVRAVLTVMTGVAVAVVALASIVGGPALLVPR
jgi:hypothetical protein